MTKSNLVYFLVALFVFGGAFAQTQSRSQSRKAAPPAAAAAAQPRRLPLTAGEIDLRNGLIAYKNKDYLKAAEILFRATRVALPQAEREQALLFTGLALYRLGLRQSAAFPLVKLSSIGSLENKKKALDVLVSIADYLDERSLLEYSLERIKPTELSETGLEVMYYRLGEISLRNHEFDKAVSYFHQAGSSDQAVYSLGMAYLYKNDTTSAIPIFQKLLEHYEKSDVTSRKKGMAELALARAYYQAKNWPAAVEIFRRIPVDHPFYRESQKELSWALFRSGRFRAALSPLLTLHTPYYQEFYDPEALLLHGIILLFSCRYDEIEPLIKTFDESYQPAIAKVAMWIQGERKLMDYFTELDKGYQALNRLHRTGDLRLDQQIPFFMVRTILFDKSISSEIRYLDLLRQEASLAKKTFAKAEDKRLLDFISAIIAARATSSRTRMAAVVKGHIKQMVEGFEETVTQFEILKYETLNGLRTQMRSKVLGQQTEHTVDDTRSRDYYVRNGYRFWPFQGEFWRDEVGSYQYTGVNLCEAPKE